MGREKGNFGVRHSWGIRLCLVIAIFALEGISHASVASSFTSEVPCATRDIAIASTVGKVSVHAGSLVDAYDSDLGNYGGANILPLGTVQAAANIVQNGGTINGDKIQYSTAQYEQVEVPSGVINLPLGATSPGSLNINPGTVVTLPPGNYVAQNVNISYNGRLNISPAGQVNIYVTGSLNLGGLVNVGGSPGNLSFLVVNPGYVNVNASGQLRGSIYAPRAVVQLNSQVFGSVVGREVNLNSGSAVHHDRALGCLVPPPIAVEPPRTLPPPPLENGCYVGSPNGWLEVPCTREGTIEDYFPVPEPAIESIATTVSEPMLLQYAEVDATFSAFGSVISGATRPDAFSIQANSNYFDRATGERGWFQWTIQTQRTSPDFDPKIAVCMWDFYDARFPLVYETHCVGDVSGLNTDPTPLMPYTIYRRPGSYQQFDFGTVAGTVFEVGGQRKVGLVAQMSFFDASNDPTLDQGLYSVVKDDTWDLAGNWTAIGGGVYGDGSGTDVTFDESSVVNRMLAGTCSNALGPVPQIPWPGSCPTQEPLLPNARLNPDLINTGEGSNLRIVGGEGSLTLQASSPDLVYTQWLASSERDPDDPTIAVCVDDTARVYVKDNPSDNGVVPSNINGQPFWWSPDLFLVPTGSTVDPDAPAPPIVVVPGATYDAYMRVHNDYSCEDVTGVRVRMHIADPAALSQPWGEPITGGIDYTSQNGTAGVTIAAGESMLIGPFTYTAPTTGGAGHKCMLGALISDNQSPASDEFDAPYSYQVAQRNLAVEECAYPLTNATTDSGWVQLTIVADGALPSLTGDNAISMTFDDPTQDWFDAWSGGADTTYAVTHAAGLTSVRLGPPSGTTWMGRTSLTLPPVPIGAGVTINSVGEIGLAPGAPDTTLSIAATQFGSYGYFVLNNGGSCAGLAPPPLNCGDGTLDSDEECDDGNTAPGDGCDERCKSEPFCGDGNVDAGEECDDANSDNFDGCLNICLISTGTGPFLEESGLVVMEAESRTGSAASQSTNDSWGTTNVTGASGGVCMLVGPDNGQQDTNLTQADVEANAARMDYLVNFETTGTWYIWVRGGAATNQGYAGDSCHAGINGVAQVLALDYPDGGSYDWRRGSITVPSAGEHTINVFMREDGFFADKIILTTDAAYTPSGIAQAESPRL